ncbi:MAG: DUF4215 domain-containing protein [Myxococcota bacterium]
MKVRWAWAAVSAPLLVSVAAGCGRSELTAVAIGIEQDTETSSSSGSSSGTDPTSDDTSTTIDTFDTSTTIDTFDTSTTFDDTTTTSGGNCGDGVLDPGEECDPGDPLIGPGQACLPGCIENVCGDGDIGPDEQCDDGNDIDDDGCRNDCVLGSCGDGNVDVFEDCDDGNPFDDDACIDCVDARCGDGFIFEGVEQCDDGDGNNGPDQFCTSECLINVCGDGFQGPGEECDPGADQIGPGQFCLDGCILNVCGDGDQWAGEACDDGNDDNTDACVNCSPAECGDGFVFAGVEECDDANPVDIDACRNDCSFHRVTKMGLGGNHTCALFETNRVLCWGNGNNGRTGNGNEQNIGDDEPAFAAGFIDAGGPVADIATALSHTCFHYEGEGLRCFGRGLEGQLGYGNTNDLGDDEVPADLGLVPLGGPSTVFGARGGAFHSCAVLDGTGEVRCWGAQTFFQLGVPGLLENIGDDETAAFAGVVNVGAGTIAEVVTGARHSCVRFDDGRVRCWGEASDGALGYGNINDIGDGEFPAAAGDVPVGAGAVALTAGFFHTCVITDDDDVRCWGRGASGRLGYGNTVSVGVSTTPQTAGAVDIGPGVPVQIAAGLAHTCVMLDDGAVRCWGDGGQGQLGYGNTATIGDGEAPSTAGDVALGGAASGIFADGNHTCAIMEEDGSVRCWGQGGDGRLGYGNLASIGDNETPASAGPVPLFP